MNTAGTSGVLRKWEGNISDDFEALKLSNWDNREPIDKREDTFILEDGEFDTGRSSTRVNFGDHQIDLEVTGAKGEISWAEEWGRE